MHEVPTEIPPHVQQLSPISSWFLRSMVSKLPPSHPSKGRKEKKVKAFVAFEKRVEIKSWLSQKLRKAKVYSDKLTNQNVLFFRLHKKQDVTCAPTRVPGAYFGPWAVAV